ncbi:MAG: Helix-turn-helix domain [Acidobacteriota bacterium]|jgi:transcriptional regulator with XRE-family HTH domain|nr:Helix-turn-helix domain [Acidobacteriota bacterium]
MKLGQVLKKERERKKLSPADTASRLGIPEDRYAEIEAGGSPVEKWGPLLFQSAVKLETPTSRLLAESGKSKDCKPGQAGELIRKHRERKQITADQFAQQLGITREEFDEIEAGRSGIEEYGPLLLGFAEIIEQPVFNLYLPHGIQFDQLDDYP